MEVMWRTVWRVRGVVVVDWEGEEDWRLKTSRASWVQRIGWVRFISRVL